MGCAGGAFETSAGIAPPGLCIAPPGMAGDGLCIAGGATDGTGAEGSMRPPRESAST